MKQFYFDSGSLARDLTKLVKSLRDGGSVTLDIARDKYNEYYVSIISPPKDHE